ncbi:hypothetical protein Pint_29940 [Pistacia integerrima]|uniref:Uncharacterized protein n=1 Tax=Pistacia integerrima TaxID=434235 RepID=A0ACC0X164_9ROSI|nr:hypothetical protein Pint_29940 [Pistacia integerrima]
MGSESSLRLPVIGFSKPNLKPCSPEWDSVKSQVRKAVQEYGCFEALFDKVDKGSKDNNLIVAGVFQLTSYFNSCIITMQYVSEQVSQLDQTIRRRILESYNLEKYMEEHIDSTNYLVRVMKYEGPQTTETQLGLPTHSDVDMATILYQNQVDGLEVRTKNGEWIQLKPSPASFTAWTNGQLYAPHHRVMMTGNQVKVFCRVVFNAQEAARNFELLQSNVMFP